MYSIKKLLGAVVVLISIQVSAQKFEDDSALFQIPNLNVLDSLVGKHRVFLTGENHLYYGINNSIELQMLKYLHKTRGVKDLVIELGFARGYMMDRYINDDTTYYELLRRTTGSMYLKFYRDLRAWNQTLDSNERIHVHGVDVERFPDDAPVLMARILKDDSLPKPKSIEFICEVIQSYAEYKQTQLSTYPEYTYESEYYNTSYRISDNKTIDSLVVEYKVLRNDFKAHLGDRFELFDKAMVSLEEHRKYEKYESMPHQFIFRERYLFSRMVELLEEDTNRAVFGQFGRCHIGLNQVMNDCDWWDHSPMAKRINDSKYRGQLMNIAILYESEANSSFYYTDEGEFIKSFKDSMKSSRCRIFKLNASDSMLLNNFQCVIIYKGGTRTTKVSRKSRMYSHLANSIDLYTGISMFNFNKLNAALDPSLMNTFNRQVQTFDVAYTTANDGVFSSFGFRYLNEQKLKFNNYRMSLSGYSIYESIGYSPKIARNFYYGIGVMFAYSQLNLRVQNDSIPTFSTPGFSHSGKVRYNNSAFGIGASLDMKLALGGFLALSMKAHVLSDPSLKNWRIANGEEDNLDKASPRTSLFNYGVSLGLAIMFYENYYD